MMSQKAKLLISIGSQVLYIIDAIMFCSSSENELIRSVSFQALSSLSEYSSDDRTVLAQIQRDTNIHDTKQDYKQFVYGRIESEKRNFLEECRVQHIEKIYPGIFSLIQIAYGSSFADLENAIQGFTDYTKMIQKHEDKKPLQIL